MFTGIVEELGSVAGLAVHADHARLEVACSTVVQDASIGDSIAVNGCCLTVTGFLDDQDGRRGGFAADLMAETMQATSLRALGDGDAVNLERAMSASTRFGGHIVQGHVDGVGQVVGRAEEPGTTWITTRVPLALAPYLVAKGSITLDGTSLTVVTSETTEDGVDVRVGLIPHTLDVTVWGQRDVGDLVNVEADVIAKYVERMLVAGVQTPYASAATPTTRES